MVKSVDLDFILTCTHVYTHTWTQNYLIIPEWLALEEREVTGVMNMKKCPTHLPWPPSPHPAVFLDFHVDSSQADKISSFLAEPSVWGDILDPPKCQKLT